MAQLEPNAPVESSGGLSNSLARKYLNEAGLLVAIVVVILFTAVVDDSYREKPLGNASELFRQTALLGIFALGAGTVIIAGGIDLSSGSVIAFSGAVCASILLALAPVDELGNPVTNDLSAGALLVAVAGTILVGILIGSFHAWLITVIQLPPFVATLASLVGLRSLARLLVQDVNGALTRSGRNTQIYVNDAFFRELGSTWWIPVVVFLALCSILWFLLSRTVVGRHLYAMGGNEDAARLSGIRTDRLKWLAYCIGSVTASIAGILFASYVGMSDPTTQGIGYELNAIAAAVVGGCSLQGGIGTVAGIALGALFLRVVMDAVGKTVKTNPDEFQGLIVGVLVVLAVAFNELRKVGGFRKQFFPGALGVVNIIILSLLVGMLAIVMKSGENKLPVGVIAAVVAFVVLLGRKLVEMRDRPQREV